MADSKITALTSIGASTDPANDPLVLVDVSDTSMAATGTTKKVTLNQLLGASGTATLASATITGDLTVDTSTLKVDSTNNRVGIVNASPLCALHIGTTGGTNKLCINTAVTNSGDIQLKRGGFIGFSTAADTGNSEYIFANAGALEIGVNASTRFAIASDGVATWSNVGGVAGTAMTLNSTGLGVGGSPTRKLSIVGSGATYANINSGDNTSLVGLLLGGTSTPSAGQLIYDNTANSLALFTGGSPRMTLDSSGRMLVGRTSAISAETFSSIGFAIIGGATHQALIGESSGNVFAGSFTNTAFRIRTNNVEVAQFDASGNFLTYLTSTAPTLSTNGAMVFNLTSNTNLRISVRGTDGVTRTANITLA